MVQLVFINGSTRCVLPYTSRDNYECYPEEVGSKLDMISGRVVWETRGHVQKIRYHYDYMEPAMWRTVASFLRSSRAFTVEYLPDDSDEMRSSTFICESLTSPKFAFEDYPYDGTTEKKPFWHGVEFTLREVSPHD